MRHVSASSVSRQIAWLEYEFGAPLLIRHAQGVKLAPAGEIVGQFIRGRTRREAAAAGDGLLHRGPGVDYRQGV